MERRAEVCGRETYGRKLILVSLASALAKANEGNRLFLQQQSPATALDSIN